MTNAIIGLDHTKIGPKTFCENLDYWVGEGPKWRTREGGSEWEPVKILFKNSAYEPDFTRALLQASLAKFTQPLKCY
jgi:hypothetical protein